MGFGADHGKDEAAEQAYCWLVYWSHHVDGSLSCDEAGCSRCASKAAADALLAANRD